MCVSITVCVWVATSTENPWCVKDTHYAYGNQTLIAELPGKLFCVLRRLGRRVKKAVFGRPVHGKICSRFKTLWCQNPKGGTP